VPGVVQTIIVCRLRTLVEFGRPRKTMACPTAKIYSPQALYAIHLHRCAVVEYEFLFRNGRQPL
jgi:hypothetical protein